MADDVLMRSARHSPHQHPCGRGASQAVAAWAPTGDAIAWVTNTVTVPLGTTLAMARTDRPARARTISTVRFPTVLNAIAWLDDEHLVTVRSRRLRGERGKAKTWVVSTSLDGREHPLVVPSDLGVAGFDAITLAVDRGRGRLLLGVDDHRSARALMVVDLQSMSAWRLPGTAGALAGTWSPDDCGVAFLLPADRSSTGGPLIAISW
jgi:hypothetical protein